MHNEMYPTKLQEFAQYVLFLCKHMGTGGLQVKIQCVKRQTKKQGVVH